MTARVPGASLVPSLDLHRRLETMTGDELIAFGKRLHSLVYPLSDDGEAEAADVVFFKGSTRSGWGSQLRCKVKASPILNPAGGDSRYSVLT